jgi:hypothetical protein
MHTIETYGRRFLSAARTFRRRLYTMKIEKFRDQHASRPAPLETCIKLQEDARRVFNDPDCLVRPEQQCPRTGENIRDAQIAEMYRNTEPNPWRLADETMNWLVDFLYCKRPRVVLEFGSGLSTACLCVTLAKIHGPDGFRLLSVEQDMEELGRTLGRLDQYVGSHSCRVMHAPLMRAVVAERPTFFYDFIESSDDFSWMGKAEFVLIDGPFAPGPCREGTLSQVRPHLQSGADFMMDDALREKELFAGALWARSGIAVEGVLTIGEGIMIGHIP